MKRCFLLSVILSLFLPVLALGQQQHLTRQDELPYGVATRAQDALIAANFPKVQGLLQGYFLMGGRRQLAAGTFETATPFYIDSCEALMGAAKHSTFIKYTGTGAAVRFHSGFASFGYHQGGELRNLTIQATNPAGYCIGIDSNVSGSFQESTIENVVCINSGTLATVNLTTNGITSPAYNNFFHTIRNLWITGYGTGGAFKTDARNIRIEGLITHNNVSSDYTPCTSPVWDFGAGQPLSSGTITHCWLEPELFQDTEAVRMMGTWNWDETDFEPHAPKTITTSATPSSLQKGDTITAAGGTKTGVVISTSLTKIRYEFHGSDFLTSDTISCTARSFSSACTTATYYEDRISFKMDNCRLKIDKPFYVQPGSQYSLINSSRMRIDREFEPTANAPAGTVLTPAQWNTTIQRDGTSKIFFCGFDIARFESSELDWNAYK